MTTNAEGWFNVALRLQKLSVRLIRTESPGRSPRLSHSSWTLEKERKKEKQKEVIVASPYYAARMHKGVQSVSVVARCSGFDCAKQPLSVSGSGSVPAGDR